MLILCLATPKVLQEKDSSFVTQPAPRKLFKCCYCHPSSHRLPSWHSLSVTLFIMNSALPWRWGGQRAGRIAGQLEKLPEPGSLRAVVGCHSAFAHSHFRMIKPCLTGLEMSEAAVDEANLIVRPLSVASVSCFPLGRHTLNVPELRFLADCYSRILTLWSEARLVPGTVCFAKS